MNAKQRRMRRRAMTPYVLALIDGFEAAAKSMEETGQTMTPGECRNIAAGVRELLAGNPEWKPIARGARKA